MLQPGSGMRVVATALSRTPIGWKPGRRDSPTSGCGPGLPPVGRLRRAFQLPQACLKLRDPPVPVDRERAVQLPFQASVVRKRQVAKTCEVGGVAMNDVDPRKRPSCRARSRLRSFDNRDNRARGRKMVGKRRADNPGPHDDDRRTPDHGMTRVEISVCAVPFRLADGHEMGEFIDTLPARSLPCAGPGRTGNDAAARAGPAPPRRRPTATNQIPSGS